MSKNVVYLILLTIFVIILICFIYVFIKKGGNNVDVIDGGVTKRGRLQGYEEIIKSKNIITFDYNNPNYHLECKKDNNVINITATGGYSNERDGRYFKLNYNTKKL